MIHRFIEVEDEALTKHARLSIFAWEPADFAYVSTITGRPLLRESVAPVARSGGGLTPTTLHLLDLQTQEGLLFDPAQDESMVRRRFLVHPIHVCVLFFPLMLWLSRNRRPVQEYPAKVVLSVVDVIAQPGMLLDRFGVPIRTRAEWSARKPIAARLRNREVSDPDQDYQDMLTEDELAEARGARPQW